MIPRTPEDLSPAAQALWKIVVILGITGTHRTPTFNEIVEEVRALKQQRDDQGLDSRAEDFGRIG